MRHINWLSKVIVITVGVVVIDQFTKGVVSANGWYMVINKGVSFGWRPAGEWLTITLVVLVGVLSAVSFRYWRRAPLVAGLFLGGVTANLLDRISYGGVRDWLPIPWTGLYNNLADWAIAVAVVLLLYQSFIGKNADSSLQRAEKIDSTLGEN